MRLNYSILVSLLLFVNLHAYSQTVCSSQRASSSSGKLEDYVYKKYTSKNGKEESLHLALVKPVDNLPDKKRPLIIGLHGSGFLNTCVAEDCYLKYGKEVLIKNFTLQGYAVISIEYRLISPFAFNPFHIKDDKIRDAHYKAAQDVRQAIQFIFENADKFGIDTENVFLIGTSAGAITALNAAYLDNDEVPADLLEKYGALRKRERIKGVISLSGAIYDLSYLDGGDKIPLMIVHGTNDFIVPIDKGYYLKLKHLTPVYGGRAVLKQAETKGIPAQGYFYDTGHGYPESALVDIFKNANDFIKSNLSCTTRN